MDHSHEVLRLIELENEAASLTHDRDEWLRVATELQMEASVLRPALESLEKSRRLLECQKARIEELETLSGRLERKLQATVHGAGHWRQLSERQKARADGLEIQVVGEERFASLVADLRDQLREANHEIEALKRSLSTEDG